MTGVLAQTEPIFAQNLSNFAPSRYGSGQPILPETRDHQIRVVAREIARVFGGASAKTSPAKRSGLLALSAIRLTSANALSMKRSTVCGP